MHTAPSFGLPTRRAAAWKVSAAGLVLLLAMAGAGCGDRPREVRKADRAPQAAVRIMQFYAGSAAVPRGGEVLLCYGVENARAVRIEPAVGAVAPAYNRCVRAAPAETVKYTLTAEGEDGRTVTASVVVQVVRELGRKAVAAAPPVEPPGPVVVSFRTEKKPGLTLLCYEVESAEAVAIEPGVLARSGAIRGCLGVAPRRPVTYTLTAFGAGGRSVQRSVTVEPD